MASLAGPAEAQTLKIAIEAPLSGPTAVFGAQLSEGARRGVADANTTGGFNGAPGAIELHDDAGDVARGTKVAEDLVAAKVPFVIGPFNSAVAVPATEALADAGIVAISPSAAAPALTDRGLATIFRLASRDDAQAAIAARALLGRHYAKIAIVHDRTTGGKAFADAVRAELAKAGRRDVYYGSLDKSAPETVPVFVARLKASGAQAVVWGGAGTGAALLVRQLRDTGSKMVLLGDTALASEDFGTAAGNAAEGVLMVFPQDPRLRPAAADLTRKLRPDGKDGEDNVPGAYVFYAYAAVQVLQQAADAAHSVDPKNVAATMHSGRVFNTILGALTFDEKGDAVPNDLAVYIWHRGPTGRMTFDELAKS